MKSLFLLTVAFLMNNLALQSQVIPPGQREVWFKFLQDEGKVLFVDAREGLKMPAQDLILGDSISFKLFGRYWNLSD